MLTTASRHSLKNSGQAVMELLPAMMMFFIVLFACLSYFRAMRSAVMREEAVRNVAFAKINNSGTLTTMPNQITALRPGCGGNTQTLCVGGEVIGSNTAFYRAIVGDKRVNSSANCFVLNLEGGLSSLELGPLGFSSAGEPKMSARDINITTYAVVHRRPAGDCGGAY